MPASGIADAASLIVLRRLGGERQVLMGQRAAGAVFMPSKFVFPGGRVDCEDDVEEASLQLFSARCLNALMRHVSPCGMEPARLPRALLGAGLRELQEETGLHLARRRPSSIRFVFRAITPKGSPRRFDARFFLANAADFEGDMASFKDASGELSNLQWLSLPDARGLDLPFITQIILAEIQHAADDATAGDAGVPFFDNSDETSQFLRL